ncbi:MAG: hypothetical protein H7Y31_11380 [Chitinophagaceae bacterium]|nr:hypothetical protein [Chitinophagaceae bacterium]
MVLIGRGFVNQDCPSVKPLFQTAASDRIFVLSNQINQLNNLLFTNQKIMKSLSLTIMAIAVLFAATTFVSCKKETTPAVIPPVANTIEGSWKGKYGTGNEAPDEYFAFTIAKNGELSVFSGNENAPTSAKGTWTLEDNVLKGKYKYGNLFIEYTFAAKYDAEAKTLNGSWGIGDKESGTFSLDKK